MAAETISKLGIRLISSPWILAATICARTEIWGLQRDLNRCFEILDIYGHNEISVYLWKALVSGEDRRNLIHVGIDPISMIRAVTHFILRGRIEGASTIEQQFVRVVTGNYDRTISRKLREQFLAVLLTSSRKKVTIATAYIKIAFYGKDLDFLLSCLDTDLTSIDVQQAAEIVARLKYPEPNRYNIQWKTRFNLRKRYILNLLDSDATLDQNSSTRSGRSSESPSYMVQRFGQYAEKRNALQESL